MSVRKRVWTTRQGEQKEAWIVDYVDQQGDRHIQTFERKREADDHHASVKVDVRKGLHTSNKLTVKDAAADWLTWVAGEQREPTTVAFYKNHVVKYIVPRLGKHKLATLTTPGIEQFRDGLLTDVSRLLAKKVLQSVKAILKDAQRRGNVAQNVASSVLITMSSRHKPKLTVGKDIPSRAEIGRILNAAKGRGRALLLTAAFTGLRASELRGLRWQDVALDKQQIHVRQRADRLGNIGSPKSKAGERTLPIGPMVVNTLKEWKLACPKSDRDLVFPTGPGNIEFHANIVARIVGPVQVAANVIDQNGRPKYGMHSFRHFYASWCINRRQDGGLELPAKTVQTRLGHASIVMTLDRYGHLFPSHDDGAEWRKPRPRSLRHRRDTYRNSAKFTNVINALYGAKTRSPISSSCRDFPPPSRSPIFPAAALAWTSCAATSRSWAGASRSSPSAAAA
jgi:integrase